MSNKKIQRIETISAFHKLQRLPEPEHPLISIVDVEYLRRFSEPKHFVYDFYCIALKRDCSVKFNYGQQQYDFDEGVMVFIAPNQAIGIEHTEEVGDKRSGQMLLIHPDFLWDTPLAKALKQYEFFGYSTNEALFLSKKEENTMLGVIENIRQEYHENIDEFSQDIIISQIDTLLNYAERFYRRQFITRKVSNHKILDQLEKLLNGYFNSDNFDDGLLTVQSVAENLNVSPNYLSTLLKKMTGQSTQQHIHNKLIGKAKEQLSTTELSVSEIAYDLGFEHPQSFSRLFKRQTHFSPLEFRNSFN